MLTTAQIDWSRMAKPQPDGYDTDMLALLDYTRFGWSKINPLVPATPVTLADHAVAIGHPVTNMTMGDGSEDVAELVTQAWADEQTTYLNKWDAGYQHLRRYLDQFWPWRSGSQGRGCSSGHHVMTQKHLFHAVYVTIDDLEGCAQGIYHEVGHSRLNSMGIYIESHDYRLLLNDPTELYNSSVRFDIKRPMSAVLHGLYSWLMFVENDYALYASGQTDRGLLRTYVAHNLPKIDNGITEVLTHGKFTTDGLQFIEGIASWASDLVSRCSTALKTA